MIFSASSASLIRVMLSTNSSQDKTPSLLSSK